MGFKLDLGKFKKVKSDQHSTTMRHEDGHVMTIAHSALSPSNRKEIMALPAAFSEGGDVEMPAIKKENYAEGNKKKVRKYEAGGDVAPATPDESVNSSQMPDKNDFSPQSNQDTKPAPEPGQMPAAPPPVVVNVNGNGAAPAAPSSPQPVAAPAAQPAAQAMMQSFADNAQAPNASPDSGASAPQGAQQPSAPQKAATGQPQPSAPDQFGINSYEQNAMQGIQEQKQGIVGEAKALGQQGAAEAKVAQQAAANMQQNLNDYKGNYANLDKERNAFVSDIQNQHIDPDRYYSKMGIGGKIATAIGLILGGSDARDYVQRQVNMDIDAQKAELGKKENLLSANMKQFGNLKDATDMTRVMMNDVVVNKLKAEAAKAQDPIAKSRALQAAGKLDMESAPILSQIAMRKTLLSGMSQGRVDPSKVVNFLVPENQRADANKELKEAVETAKFRDMLLSGADQVAKLQTLGSRLSNPRQSRRQIELITGPLIAALSQKTAGRFTEQDAEMIKPLFAQLLDSPDTVAAARIQLNKMASEKLSPDSFPILNTYGIKSDSLGRYNSTGGSRDGEVPAKLPVK